MMSARSHRVVSDILQIHEQSRMTLIAMNILRAPYDPQKSTARPRLSHCPGCYCAQCFPHEHAPTARANGVSDCQCEGCR